MGLIGEKLWEYQGKMTSVTPGEAGKVVNTEGSVEQLGTVLVTETFALPVDAAGETGPATVHGQAFLANGETLSFTGAGTWRKSGVHQWEAKWIQQTTDGQRLFVVEEHDLASRSVSATVYALD